MAFKTCISAEPQYCVSLLQHLGPLQIQKYYVTIYTPCGDLPHVLSSYKLGSEHTVKLYFEIFIYKPGISI